MRADLQGPKPLKSGFYSPARIASTAVPANVGRSVAAVHYLPSASQNTTDEGRLIPAYLVDLESPD